MAIKGIGHETADSILLYAFDRPIFVVDAYTKRILSRMGWIDEKDSYGEVQDFFAQNLDEDVDQFNDFHAQFVALGKDYCKTKPICDECPLYLSELCRGLFYH